MGDDPTYHLRVFRSENYAELCEWFEDDVLNEALGPLDTEWLEAVLAEDPPRQYTYWRGDRMVGLVGAAFPSDEHPEFVVTDVSVRPDLRRTGIGRRALRAVMAQVGDGARPWVAWVMPRNLAAQAFFTALGWTRSIRDSQEMIEYRLDAVHDGSGQAGR